MSAAERDALLDYLRLLEMMGVRYVRDLSRMRPVATRAPAPSSGSRTAEAPLFAVAAPSSGAPSAVAALPSAAPVEDLAAIREDLGDCRRCKLCEGRNKIVFGDGNPRADLVFVGEGPGADEDAQGLPFVGAAGQLLDKIIAAMGLERRQVYIGNVVKCRPPKNRTPEEDEIRACMPFIVRQIESIRPRAVCALGLTAAQALTESRESMGRMRGKLRPLTIGRHETMFLATYHPAYLLRSPDKKRDVWEDVQKIMAFLQA